MSPPPWPGLPQPSCSTRNIGAAQAVAGGVIPRGTPFVVAVESTGYGGEPTARQSQILPGWSVEKAKRMGASMIKLLVYYHPDSPTAS